MKILALGPAGTNGHQAASSIMRLMPESARPEIELCDSHATIFRRVIKEQCVAVVPIENSGEGGLVTDTVRGFWLKRPIGWSGTSVIGEITLPIEHVLAMRPGEVLLPTTPVLSHPQALAQCRENLKDLCLIRFVPTNSTAGAGEMVARDNQHGLSAALVSPFAAIVYRLEVIKPHMEDVPGNTTRFHVLGHSEWPPTADCKTALIVWMHDVPLALHNVTWAIGAAGANMSSMEVLRLGTPGKCAFYVEFNEHVGTREGKNIMKRLETVTDRVLWLGSFPQEQSIRERDFGAAQGRPVLVLQEPL